MTFLPHAGLQNVKDRIAAAALLAHRAADEISLIAVSKTFDAPDIEPVLKAGQNEFGENRVQEAQGKWPGLRQQAQHLKLHLIGPLQTNKVRDAVALFDVIHTLDRPRLAQALAREIMLQDRKPKLFIQVNTGREPQKAGIDLAFADGFIDECRERHGLSIAGLMCIPPVDEKPEQHFGLLATLARRHGLPSLSMGMSGDFESAIACGATHVRVGSAIFGTRDAPGLPAAR